MKLEIEAVERGFIVEEYDDDGELESTTVFAETESVELAHFIDAFIAEHCTRNDKNDEMLCTTEREVTDETPQA